VDCRDIAAVWLCRLGDQGPPVSVAVVNATIPPQGELAVKVHVRPKPGVSLFHQRVLFYLDSSQQYVVAADLFGTVQEN
jgi:hypothetical protein